MNLGNIKNVFNKVSNLDVKDKTALELFKESVVLKREGNKNAVKSFIKFFDKIEEEHNEIDKVNSEKLAKMEEEIVRALQSLDPNSLTYESSKSSLTSRLEMVKKQKEIYDKKNQLYDLYEKNYKNKGVRDMAPDEIYGLIPEGKKTK